MIKSLSRNKEGSAAAKVAKVGKTEQEAISKAFAILCSQFPQAVALLAGTVESNGHNQLCNVLINLSLTSGVTFPMIRFFIEDDFAKNARGDPGAIMRGNCIASKLTKEYLNRVGMPYLNMLVGPFMQQLVEAEKSLEIDPTKMESGQDIEQNKKDLTEKIRNLLTHLVSQEMVHKMPLEIKVVASYFGELATRYAPSQFHALVGGFLLLRYINPAISVPEAYGLVGEGKVSPITQRNLILISKVLQNLSNGVEFSQKEQFMTCMNDFIRANTWKLEKYFQAVVSPFSSPQKLVDPDAATEADYIYM